VVKNTTCASLSGQLVPRLEANGDTLIELRWILNWITLRSLVNDQQSANSPDWFSHSPVEDIIPFLRSIAVYIIQNQILSEDHGLFNSLLLATQSIADACKEVDYSHNSMKLNEPRTSSGRVDGGLFISVGDSLVPPESQWEFVRKMYAASSMLDLEFKHDFTLLVILLMICTLIAAERSGICIYDRFVNPEKDLPVLMDGLWETWKTHSVDHSLLTGTATWLLERSSGSFYNPRAYPRRRRVQELLNAYDSRLSIYRSPH